MSRDHVASAIVFNHRGTEGTEMVQEYQYIKLRDLCVSVVQFVRSE